MNIERVRELVNAPEFEMNLTKVDKNGVATDVVSVMGPNSVGFNVNIGINNEEEVAELIKEAIESLPSKDDLLNGYDLLNYEAVKEKIIPMVHNREVKDAAYVQYLDLKVYFRIVLQKDEENGKMQSIVIKADLAKQWGVTPEQLLEQAKANVRDDFEVNNFLGQMTYITNKSKIYGGNVILFPELIKEKGFEGKYFIVPSSIHEVLVVEPREDLTYEDLTEMVQSVNTTEVRPEEVMSDHPYVYNDGIITCE